MLVMLTYLRVESEVVVSAHLCNLPSECELEFAIYLVPRIKLVSVAPYRMFTLELGELKK